MRKGHSVQASRLVRLYAQYNNKGYTDKETVPYIGSNGEMLIRI